MVKARIGVYYLVDITKGYDWRDWLGQGGLERQKRYLGDPLNPFVVATPTRLDRDGTVNRAQMFFVNEELGRGWEFGSTPGFEGMIIRRTLPPAGVSQI